MKPIHFYKITNQKRKTQTGQTSIDKEEFLTLLKKGWVLTLWQQ